MVRNDKGSLEYRLVSKIGRFMSNKKDDPEYDEELFGTSPRVIGIFMVLVTVLCPVGMMDNPFTLFSGQTRWYSGFWLIRDLNDLWSLFRPEDLFSTLYVTIPLCAFNFIFIIQVNRFFQGKTSRDIALFFGLLSMVIPTLFTWVLYFTAGGGFIITPIPIQFFVGIILLYKFKEPEVIGPWQGYFLDWSWWIRLRHSAHDTSGGVINLTNLLKDHDAVWLEGYDD